MAKKRKPSRKTLAERYRLAHADKDFCDWWEAYPRKVAKMNGYFAWISATEAIREVKGFSHQEATDWLLKRTVVFSSTDVAKDKEFCPYPASWLNGARFDDDPAEWNKSQPEPAKYRIPTDEEARNHRF